MLPVVVCGWCKLTSDLDPTPVQVILIGPKVCKLVQIYIFRLSYTLTSHELWPWFVTFDHMNIWRFPYYINKLSLVHIGLKLFKWGHNIFSLSYNLTSDDLWPWYMTFDCMSIWRFTHNINKPSLVQIGLQLFKWGHFHISAYLTTWPQMTFDLDIWPLTSSTNEGSHVASMTQLWLESIYL